MKRVGDGGVGGRALRSPGKDRRRANSSSQSTSTRSGEKATECSLLPLERARPPARAPGTTEAAPEGFLLVSPEALPEPGRAFPLPSLLALADPPPLLPLPPPGAASPPPVGGEETRSLVRRPQTGWGEGGLEPAPTDEAERADTEPSEPERGREMPTRGSSRKPPPRPGTGGGPAAAEPPAATEREDDDDDAPAGGVGVFRREGATPPCRVADVWIGEWGGGSWWCPACPELA